VKLRNSIRTLAAAALIALAQGAPAQEPPEAVYAKFHRALAAGNLDEMLKYAPAARRAELAGMPAAQKQATVEFMARLAPKNHAITGKQVSPDGNRATLRATGTGTALLNSKPETQYGTIAMVKEGGEWKVDQTSWDNNPKAQAAPPVAAPVPAASPAAASPAASGTAARAATPTTPAPRSAESKRRAETRNPDCVIKPVMTDEDRAKCR